MRVCKNCDQEIPVGKIMPVSGLCYTCGANAIRDKQRSKPKRRLRSVSKRKKKEIDLWPIYARERLEYELEAKGIIRCCECGFTIADSLDNIPLKKISMCVAHIIAGGIARKFYYLRENSIILCWKHHQQLDRDTGGLATDLRIYDAVQTRKKNIRQHFEVLKNLSHNLKYYDGTLS